MIAFRRETVQNSCQRAAQRLEHALHPTRVCPRSIASLLSAAAAAAKRARLGVSRGAPNDGTLCMFSVAPYIHLISIQHGQTSIVSCYIVHLLCVVAVRKHWLLVCKFSVQNTGESQWLSRAAARGFRRHLFTFSARHAHHGNDK